eukprot:SAG31_NODE_183_length_20987_cov_8.711078_5_plen_190_part_00
MTRSARSGSVSGPHQHGPAADTVWTVPRHDDGVATPHSQIRVFDAFGFVAFVEQATIVIGDNITALKWASVDAVTPKNKHIRTIYHWLREHIRDGSIDLHDCPTQDNMADCLTKPIMGPPTQRISDAISGYAETAPIPPRMAYIKMCDVSSTGSLVHVPSVPYTVWRRSNVNSLSTDQVGGVRGDAYRI